MMILQELLSRIRRFDGLSLMLAGLIVGIGAVVLMPARGGPAHSDTSAPSTESAGQETTTADEDHSSIVQDGVVDDAKSQSAMSHVGSLPASAPPSPMKNEEPAGPLSQPMAQVEQDEGRQLRGFGRSRSREQKTSDERSFSSADTGIAEADAVVGGAGTVPAPAHRRDRGTLGHGSASGGSGQSFPSPAEYFAGNERPSRLTGWFTPGTRPETFHDGASFVPPLITLRDVSGVH